MINSLLSILFLGLCSLGYCQEENSPQHFALFIVDGIESPEASRKIDYHMRHIQEVTLSRMDIPTDRYYVIYDGNGTIDEQWFKDKFEELGGYTIHCYYQGIKGIDNFQPITRETCSELN